MSSWRGGRFDLSPPRKPPPWMKRTRGVGLSDFAFQRSMTLRSWGPYLTFARSGGGLGWASCPWERSGDAAKLRHALNAARSPSRCKAFIDRPPALRSPSRLPVRSDGRALSGYIRGAKAEDLCLLPEREKQGRGAKGRASAVMH